MCIIAIHSFACGHELRQPISHCSSFEPLAEGRHGDHCGYISFEPISVPTECAESSCRYWGDLQGCWRCCQCRQGPNRGRKCLDEVERVLGVPNRNCRHAWCDGCEPWERRDSSRKKAGLMGRIFWKNLW